MGFPRPGDSLYTKLNEGWVNKVYSDSLGLPTCGYGFCLVDPDVARLIPRVVIDGVTPLSRDIGDKIFDTLYFRAICDANIFLGQDIFSGLTDDHKRVIVDLAYQLGLLRLSSFVRFKRNILDKNWPGAAAELLDSKYAKQCPNRAGRNAKLIKGIV
jgi:GH24 family phage-related lysozyme (muramidase)